MSPSKRCVIVGGGHNGLVAAAYLARAGHRVTVLERREVLGGACVTEELAPGYHCSTASYVVSLLDPRIVEELELARRGYRVLARDPSSFTPWPDGRYLLLGNDAERNAESIARFSARDADALPRYEAFLTRVAEALEPALMEPPPELLPLPSSWRRRSLAERLRALRGGWRLRRALKHLGDEQPAAMEMLLGAASTILDRWFESPAVKATLATDAVIGTFLPPSAPGTGYVLLHHVMGAAGGERGVWGYVAGGMGAITGALADAARDAGAELRTATPVRRIRVADGRATGVELEDGEVMDADIVLSGATPEVTFRRLLDESELPATFRAATERIDYSSASAKINLALSGPPEFSCLPTGGEVGDPHRGTIHITPDTAGMERAYADARAGAVSDEPLIEMTIPSAIDDSLAPPGHHIANLFVQYAPYALADGDWETERPRLLERCLAAIDAYAPGFRESVLHSEVLAPPDLEARFGLTGGNIFHGAMTPAQLLSLRPVPGWSDYHTPVRGLYLCGSGAHPGGGVSGMPGYNAAREVLRSR